jgi:hypothetical protein
VSSIKDEFWLHCSCKVFGKRRKFENFTVARSQEFSAGWQQWAAIWFRTHIAFSASPAVDLMIKFEHINCCKPNTSFRAVRIILLEPEPQANYGLLPCKPKFSIRCRIIYIYWKWIIMSEFKLQTKKQPSHSFFKIIQSGLCAVKNLFSN